MLRMTEFVKRALEDKDFKPTGGIVLIWNLTNRCNLRCKHCYSFAGPNGSEELSIDEIERVAKELAEGGVRFAILSGGEPLLREDIYDIARILKKRHIKTYLSTNGLLIDESNIKTIKELFDYVGISIDGTPQVHDRFRGRRYSFEDALASVILCLRENIKVGLRFTLTSQTADSLPFIFELARELGVPKLYISHLVHAGRGKRLREVERKMYREVASFIVEKAIELVEKGESLEIVTGNNEADAVILYELFKRRFPKKSDNLMQILRSWGGNQAGVRLVNIDHKGNVKPDPFFFHSVGNVKRESFHNIWKSNSLLDMLRERPRRIRGKCSSCPYIDICNGNSRARAFFATGDYLGEDPACYL